MILLRVRKFMVREYKHLKRFLSHKDPNCILGLKKKQRVVGRIFPVQSPRTPLDNIQNYGGLCPRHPGSLRMCWLWAVAGSPVRATLSIESL